MDTSWDARVQAVAVLEEPTRRRLYEYVVGRPTPVSRDDAAAALGIPRTTAAFHLDKLTEEGLLDTCFERRTGRSGPGAGRPAKLYHRSDREIEITLPERQYAVAGHLLAAAVQDADTTGVSPREAVNLRAREYGEALAKAALTHTEIGRPGADGARDRTDDRDGNGGDGDRGGNGGSGNRDRAGDRSGDGDRGGGGGNGGNGGGSLLERVLEGQGFEPRRDAGGIALGNCPFRRLAKDYPQLVCGMNLHLVAGLLAGLDTPLRAELAPTAGHCCVRITGPAPLTNPAGSPEPADG